MSKRGTCTCFSERLASCWLFAPEARCTSERHHAWRDCHLSGAFIRCQQATGLRTCAPTFAVPTPGRLETPHGRCWQWPALLHFLQVFRRLAHRCIFAGKFVAPGGGDYCGEEVNISYAVMVQQPSRKCRGRVRKPTQRRRRGIFGGISVIRVFIFVVISNTIWG
jgi:hypothetical protein